LRSRYGQTILKATELAADQMGLWC